MKRIAIALLLGVSIPAMAADTGLSGNWKLVSDIAGTTRQSNCTFTQDGAKFMGECKREEHTTQLTGSVSGKSVHMTAKSEYEGSPIDLTYEAKFVDDNTIKGTVDVQPVNAQGTFTLTKQ
jgi:hypothetical protein